MDGEKYAIEMPAMALIVNYMVLTDAPMALVLWERAEQIALAAGSSYISVEHVEQALQEIQREGEAK